MRDEKPRLKISQAEQGYEKEYRGVKGWSLSSENRLITLYNSRKENLSLLSWRGKPYKIISWRIDGPAGAVIFSDKLAMEAYQRDCLYVIIEITYLRGDYVDTF